jgi:nicotinate phosphoribosyltransferase
VGHELRAEGHELEGIRLDSGDLAHLSIQARAMLDEAGFAGAKILASNDLDEHLIADIQDQAARIDAWGVGTRLATAFDQPALGGVYKLGATRDARGDWHEAIKLSEQPIKISNPGVLQVRRLRNAGEYVGDVIYDSHHGCAAPCVLHDIEDPLKPTIAPAHDAADDLLVTIVDRGQPLPLPELEDARRRAAADLAMLSPRTKRFLNPQPYPVGLDEHVHRRKQQLIREARHA